MRCARRSNEVRLAPNLSRPNAPYLGALSFLDASGRLVKTLFTGPGTVDSLRSSRLARLSLNSTSRLIGSPDDAEAGSVPPSKSDAIEI